MRSRKVMLDSDLAGLYGVPTKRLNEALRRNRSRFPPDFAFQLSRSEFQRLRSQIATLEPGRGKHRKYLPFAFTQEGVAMLSSVLNSEHAIQVNIVIMRAFVRLRRMGSVHKDLARRLSALERKFDVKFRIVFSAIRSLMDIPDRPKHRIGFQPDTGP